MEREGLKLIDWPSNFPDLNIIEHVWPRLMSDVRRNLKSEKKEDLLEAIGHARRSCMSCHEIAKLYQSMPKRIAASVQQKGGHTKY